MATVAPERRLLKIGDVAARLNCSESTVRRLVDRGLPVLRFGHKNCSLRVDPEQIARNRKALASSEAADGG